MSTIIDLEREFFKIAKNLNKYKYAREQLLKRVVDISGKWLDNKFRLGVLGLKE